MAVPSIITDLSTTAASNSPAGTESVGPNLDNYLRAIEAIMRQESENKAWERWGHTPTYISATSFSVSGDQTIVYLVGRRIKCIVSGSPLYGVIIAASFAASITTVTVTLDSGSLTAGLTEVQLGIELLGTGQPNETKGADLASAATVNIGASVARYLTITGTNTITAFDTVQAGTRRIVRFTSALTLTHNATSLILPGAANIVTAADDVAVFVSEGSGNWRCVAFLRAWGLAQGSSRALGVDCKNNTTTPNSKYDIAATEWLVRNVYGETVQRWNKSAVTVDTAVAGPAANGRDQAGAFSASSWLHFYWIYGPGQTDAGIVSLAVPPTGPTLPTNYTHWAYAGAVRLDGSSNLIKTRIKDNTAFYEAAQVVLSGGTATTETAISLTAAVPPNASVVITKARAQYSDASVNVTITLSFRYVSGTTFTDLNVTSPSANTNTWNDSEYHVPNVSQNLYYLWSAATGTRNAALNILGYKIPNGG